MTRLRPARTFRYIFSQAWARYSQKKPRKNYIRAKPHTSLLVFNMGVDKPDFDTVFTLKTKQAIQLRSNSIESARQMINKHLELTAPGDFYFKVLVYPHMIIREHRMATGAGADRISQGMSHAFGKPSQGMSHAFGKPVSVAARLREGQPLFMVKTKAKNAQHVRESFRRASSKLSGLYKVDVEQAQKVQN
ncbi:50S ribosomal protein L16 [Candidatus Marsarchaeota archaeon]|nr:50S ribosomal protein L16 [Candidatus Marsarchaeota archaeon]